MIPTDVLQSALSKIPQKYSNAVQKELAVYLIPEEEMLGILRQRVMEYCKRTLIKELHITTDYNGACEGPLLCILADHASIFNTTTLEDLYDEFIGSLTDTNWNYIVQEVFGEYYERVMSRLAHHINS